MHNYPRAAVERMMKVQEVILRAMAKKITWWQAAEIIGMSDRQMRRLHWRYREHGYDGLLDRRVGETHSNAGHAAGGTAPPAGDAAAHRWQPAPVVSGRPLVRLAGDSGRCHQRDLLRAASRRRIDDDGAAGAAGSDRAARDFLRPLQRPRQSLLLDASGGRESGCGTSHASGTSVARIEHSDDPRLFAAGAGA